MIRALLTILIVIIMAGCDNPVTIKLPLQSNHVVVEGMITDQPGPQQIKITRLTNFSSKDPNPLVDDAQVTVFEQGLPREFTYQDNGIYLSDSSFQGAGHKSYFVQIILNSGDSIYSLSEILAPVVEIDTLTYQSFENNSALGNQQDIIYYPVVTVTDPLDTTNYYRWKVYKNGILFNEPEFIILENDRFFDGKSFRNDLISFEFDLGDNIRVDLINISRTTFEFYDLFISQTTLLGTSSGTSPAIIRGNMFNLTNPDQKVLGYFGTSSQSSKEILITE